jgi:N-acyl-D-aspartate/D-glutamate deacylase
MHLPRPEKIQKFADQAWRDALIEQAHQPGSPVGVPDWEKMVIYDVESPDNEPYRGRTVGEIAAEQGRTAWDTLCDIALADELLTSFGTRPPVETDDDWKARVEIWRDWRAVIGGSDAGAHVDMLASFNYPSIVLGEAVRRRGLLSIEEGVNLITDVPARLYGLVERGRLREGWHADVVVFDPATVGTEQVSMRRDLPGGAGRLYAGASGVEHVLVGGRAIVRGGALTGDRPGGVLRSGRDTRTPDLG